jgi:hypothetical protein
MTVEIDQGFVQFDGDVDRTKVVIAYIDRHEFNLECMLCGGYRVADGG